MFRRLARVAVIALALVASSVVAAQPTQAASGGGCTGAYPISVCISYQSGNLVADFYMNATPDSTRRHAYLWIEPTNVSSSGKYYFEITRTGRFGNATRYVITIPPSSGSAVAKVQLYTSGWTPHGLYTGNRIYY